MGANSGVVIAVAHTHTTAPRSGGKATRALALFGDTAAPGPAQSHRLAYEESTLSAIPQPPQSCRRPRHPTHSSGGSTGGVHARHTLLPLAPSFPPLQATHVTPAHLASHALPPGARRLLFLSCTNRSRQIPRGFSGSSAAHPHPFSRGGAAQRMPGHLLTCREQGPPNSSSSTSVHALQMLNRPTHPPGVFSRGRAKLPLSA